MEISELDLFPLLLPGFHAVPSICTITELKCCFSFVICSLYCSLLWRTLAYSYVIFKFHLLSSVCQLLTFKNSLSFSVSQKNYRCFFGQNLYYVYTCIARRKTHEAFQKYYHKRRTCETKIMIYIHSINFSLE